MYKPLNLRLKIINKSQLTIGIDLLSTERISLRISGAILRKVIGIKEVKITELNRINTIPLIRITIRTIEIDHNTRRIESNKRVIITDKLEIKILNIRIKKNLNIRIKTKIERIGTIDGRRRIADKEITKTRNRNITIRRKIAREREIERKTEKERRRRTRKEKLIMIKTEKMIMIRTERLTIKEIDPDPGINTLIPGDETTMIKSNQTINH